MAKLVPCVNGAHDDPTLTCVMVPIRVGVQNVVALPLESALTGLVVDTTPSE
jgi:hypothetical protein